MPHRPPFTMGPARVEPDTNRLVYDSQNVSLEPRIMDVLVMLASTPGDVVTRNDLIDTIWKVEHGADESLTRAISVIRKTLREMGCEGTFIETIPRRGYRLTQAIKPAVQSEQDKPQVTPNAPDPDQPQTGRNPVYLAVACLAVAAAGLLFIFRSNQPPETITVAADQSITEKSIAVLPFEPFSDDPQDMRFSNGITEDLVNSLSKTQGLAVAARTSSFTYQGKDVDVRDIGRALGVSFLVDGTVRRSGDQVRVTAQLIRTSDGFVVWSDTLEDTVSGTFALEDTMVREIGRALELRLGVGSGEGWTPSPDVDPRAVEFYYEGLQLYGLRFVENGAVLAASEALRTAVELEPGFAKASSALAQIGIGWSSSPLSRDKENFVAVLKTDIERALALNPDDHTLHATLVGWHAYSTMDLPQARYHLERTAALAPASVEALQAGAMYYWIVGEGEKSLALSKQVERRDPINNVPKLAVARRLAVLGQYDEAFEFFDTCQQTNCLQEGFLGYASAAAIYSGDPQRIARWSEVFREFLSFTKTLPPSLLPKVTEIHGAFFAYQFGWPQSELEAEIETALDVFDRELITDHIGMWGPTFAEILPEDMFFDTLELAHARNDLFSATYGLAPYYGANPYPDWVLQHPRYHALWTDPRLTALAEVRRANGQMDGLPK